MSTHLHNAYCQNGEHCDLVYTGPDTLEEHIAQVYGYRLGLKVTRTAPATEAPPLSMQPARMHDRLSGAQEKDGKRWLVWWRE